MPLLPRLLPHERLYPRDAYGLIRQCAWCRKVADAHGTYRLWAPGLVESASHGCCEGCAATLLRSLRTHAGRPLLAGAA